MKSPIRLLTLVALSAMTAALLAACGSDPTPTATARPAPTNTARDTHAGADADAFVRR